MLQEKLKANKKIEIIWDSVVDEVLGDNEPKGVTAIKIKNVKDNKITELKVHGLFIAIGHDPATSLFKDQLKMDKEGYLITKPDSTETNVPGVFAAGDVKDKIFRQAVTACLKILSFTSPAANTPGIFVAVESGCVIRYPSLSISN